MNCKHCQTVLEGAYCHQCGQKVIERFSLKAIGTWIAEEVFVFDRGFLYTLKEILMRPADVANQYLTGMTRKLYNPLKFLLIITSVPFFLISFNADYQSMPGNIELLKDWPQAFTMASINYFFLVWPSFILANFLTYFLISIPFWALFSKWLFRKRNLNYIEHLIYVSYLSAGIIILMMCSIPVLTLIMSQFESMSQSILWIGIVTGSLLNLAYAMKCSRVFYNESYIAVLMKGLLAAYGGLFLSLVSQFILLSTWKLLLEF